MTKRIISFIIDAFLLSSLIRTTYPMLSGESAFQAAIIQFIAVVLIIEIQHLIWSRTLGLAIFGLWIKWDNKPSLSGRFFALFPFLCYFGIPFLWATEAYINKFNPSDVWLRLPREGIDHYYPLITLGQNAILAFWLILAVAPLWIGRKRTGWELIGKFKVESATNSRS